MSVDIELQTVSSFITKSELNEQLREIKENQYELNELMNSLKNEVVKMRIDQNSKDEISSSFIGEISTQNEEPLQTYERDQKVRQMLYMSSTRKRDIFMSQREEDGAEPPQELQPPPASSQRHAIDVSLGK